MQRFQYITFVASLLGLLTVLSCDRNSYIGYEEIDGLYVKYHHRAEPGVSAGLNDWVTVHMRYRLDDTVLFNSHDFGEPMTFPMIFPTFQNDLYTGLSHLHIGDSVSFVMPADSFFMKTAGMHPLPDYVVPGSDIIFDVKLIDIQDPDAYAAAKRAALEEMRQDEKIQLAEYLEQNNIDIEPRPSGLYVDILEKGSGRLPQTGDILRLHFSIELLDGMKLYSTYDRNEPMDVEYGTQFDTEGFSEGIGYLREGGKARLILPSHLAFDSVGIDQVLPPFTPLIYEVELTAIMSAEQLRKEEEERQRIVQQQKEEARLREPQLIRDYLEKNQYVLEPLPSGLYFIEEEVGEGAPVDSGTVVSVHYVLYTIDGQQIQSSREMGQAYEVRVGTGQVIAAWDEGLQLMREGGKARFVVPSHLAYGDTQRGVDIPPYSPLVFDVELLEAIQD